MPYYANLPFLSIYLLLIFSVAVAQEKPFFHTELHNTSAFHRQNVCDRHKKYYSGEVELRNALQGLELHSMVGVSPLFPLEDGFIDPDDPGLVGRLMDELSKRAGFSWRNTFGIYRWDDGPGEGKSYTDVLRWGTQTYDVVADWYLRSAERFMVGITFPRGFYDGSIILVGKKTGTGSRKASLFSWLEPFKPTVWVTIVVMVFLSAVVYMVLENVIYQVKDKRSLPQSLYYSVFLFTQHYEFSPKSHGARVFSLSLAFWSLIISVAYTANLASVFVVQYTPNAQIESIEDAIRERLSICVAQGWGSSLYVQKTYPDGIFIQKESEKENLHGVNAGECHLALSSVTAWEEFEQDRSINGECDLGWVGRIIQYNDAGFGVMSDSGVLCTSLIQDVLHLHMTEMTDDGFVDRVWADFIRKNKDVACGEESGGGGGGDRSSSNNDTDSAAKKGLAEMAGIFFLLFIAAMVSVAMTVARKFILNPRNERRNMNYLVFRDDSDNHGAASSSSHHGNKVKKKRKPNNNAGAYLRCLDLKQQITDLENKQREISRIYFHNKSEQKQQLSTLATIIKKIGKR